MSSKSSARDFIWEFKYALLEERQDYEMPKGKFIGLKRQPAGLEKATYYKNQR